MRVSAQFIENYLFRGLFDGPRKSLDGVIEFTFAQEGVSDGVIETGIERRRAQHFRGKEDVLGVLERFPGFRFVCVLLLQLLGLVEEDLTEQVGQPMILRALHPGLAHLGRLGELPFLEELLRPSVMVWDLLSSPDLGSCTEEDERNCDGKHTMNHLNLFPSHSDSLQLSGSSDGATPELSALPVNLEREFSRLGQSAFSFKGLTVGTALCGAIGTIAPPASRNARYSQWSRHHDH